MMRQTPKPSDHRDEINLMIRRLNVKKMDIAEAIGVDKTYLYNYLNGFAMMSASKIRKICEYLGIDYVGKTNFESKKGEQWKGMTGTYEGLYLISTLGRIYSCKTDKFITIPIREGSNRVPFVILRDGEGKPNSMSLAKLMMDTFRPDWNNDVIYHLNGDRRDNRLANLASEPPATNHISETDMGVGRKNAVKNIETGIIFPSTKHAAEACNVPYHIVREHLKQRKETGDAAPVRGLTFEPASKADLMRFVITEEQKEQLKALSHEHV